jgi:hypothetical protein
MHDWKRFLSLKPYFIWRASISLVIVHLTKSSLINFMGFILLFRSLGSIWGLSSFWQIFFKFQPSRNDFTVDWILMNDSFFLSENDAGMFLTGS